MKNSIPIILLVVILFGITPLVSAQNQSGSDELSLQDAVEQALEENHQILISRNLARIDENSATRGNAGILPTLSVNSGYSESVENSRFEFPDGGSSQDVSGSRSSNLNASASLDWVLFDGFGNQYRFRSLETTRDISEAQTRREIESTLLNVISGYLELNIQQQLLDVSLESVEISNQRYQRAQQNYNTGGGSQVDLLNAEVALNSDSIRVVETELALNQARRNLLILIGDEPSKSVSTLDQYTINEELSLDTILHSALSENAQLRVSSLETDQAQLQLQQSRAGRYPQLSTQASYNYNRSESDAGQFTFQETDGFSAGLSLSFTIFDGFQRNIEIQNSEILLKNSEEQKDLTEKEVRSDVMNAFDTYTSNLYLFEKQELNVRTAELNFERTELAFEQGQVSNTDFREAQLNLLEARQELIARKAETKQSEIELLRLSGNLINTLN